MPMLHKTRVCSSEQTQGIIQMEAENGWTAVSVDYDGLSQDVILFERECWGLGTAILVCGLCGLIIWGMLATTVFG